MVNKKIRNDIILVAALLLVIATAALCMLIFRTEGDTVNVIVDGKEWGEYPLSENRTVEIKTSLGMGIESDEFASLPSGHSAYSMFAIFIFPALADYIGGVEKFRVHLFALGFIWWAITAFSRLTVGAHYLTDVTIAGIVTILAYTIALFAKRMLRCKEKVK